MRLLIQPRFEEYYYVHLPILEPVRSLQKLYKDSLVLFWAIAFTTSRHHPRHFHLYKKLREPFQSLISALLSSPVQALKDVQALLIICQWPLAVESQSEDPSWMHSGFAINAALHMGLDKIEDEVLFGHRRAKQSLGFYDPKYRRRTWLKAFQISTQYEQNLNSLTNLTFSTNPEQAEYMAWTATLYLFGIFSSETLRILRR